MDEPLKQFFEGGREAAAQRIRNLGWRRVEDGREELARRMNRVLIADPNGDSVPDAALLKFADDILAADYYDRTYGDRPGDGGPAMHLVPATEGETFRAALWEICPHIGKYGDDGEMQCRGADFRRMDAVTLCAHVLEATLEIKRATS